MLSAVTRGFAVMIVAALVANGACYGFCAAAACSPIHAPASSCHHHRSHNNAAQCQHRHAVFTGPEAGIALAGIAAVSIQPALATARAALVAELETAVCLDSDPPPGAHDSSSISILRI